VSGSGRNDDFYSAWKRTGNGRSPVGMSARKAKATAKIKDKNDGRDKGEWDAESDGVQQCVG
jgi:hypothetical protein